MASFKKIARRTFLVGSAAVVGGVAFGVYKMLEEAPNPLSAKPGETPLNAFVIINQDGVTLVTPKAEMGQGVHTTWAALLAEELDVNWDQVKTIHGQPAKAYYNSALFGLVLPFMDYSVGDWQESMRQFAGNGAKLLSLQLTGGSTSMRDGYERMRIAGATARETLKLAAAERWGLSADELRTEAGMVIAPSGQKLSYQELAVDAAEIDPPSVALREPSQWRMLGKTMPRVDMLGKVTGTATFGVDVRPDGLKFASVRMNPGRTGMKSFDASAAEAMAGVERIVDLGSGVAVVANNTWIAIQAVEAIDIEWEAPSFPATTEALFAATEAAFDEKANASPRDEGDVDKDHEGDRIEAAYKVPWLAHTTMEPMSATALYDGGSLKMWCGNQSPSSVADRCAEAVGLTADDVTLHTTLMGGGFGRRAETDFSVIAARVAAEMRGTPVQVTWSREEDIRCDFFRPGAMARFTGVVKDGKAVSLDGKIAGPSVMRNASLRTTGQEMGGPDREHVAGAADQPYQIPNYRISGHLMKPAVPIGYWRSVGSSFSSFFHDTFVDEMAHAAGRDPFEFRLELIRPEHGPSADVLARAAEMAGWTGKTPDGVGRGISFAYTFGTPVAQVIEVVDEGGSIRINKVWIAADVGVALDPGNIEAQLTGGCLYGLSAACMGEITFADGIPEQGNFYDYDALRMYNAPRFEVSILENNKFIGGIGEPGTPPAAPALGNALFDLTGTRGRELPFSKTFDLVL